MPLSEAATRAKLIDPALHDRGWVSSAMPLRYGMYPRFQSGSKIDLATCNLPSK